MLYILAKQTMGYTERIITTMKNVSNASVAAFGKRAYKMFQIHSDDDYELMRIRLFEAFLVFAKDELCSRLKSENDCLDGSMELVSEFANVLGADGLALLTDIASPSVQPGLYKSLRVLEDDSLYGKILAECMENITMILDRYAFNKVHKNKKEK